MTMTLSVCSRRSLTQLLSQTRGCVQIRSQHSFSSLWLTVSPLPLRASMSPPPRPLPSPATAAARAACWGAARRAGPCRRLPLPAFARAGARHSGLVVDRCYTDIPPLGALSSVGLLPPHESCGTRRKCRATRPYGARWHPHTRGAFRITLKLNTAVHRHQQDGHTKPLHDWNICVVPDAADVGLLGCEIQGGSRLFFLNQQNTFFTII